MRIPSSLPIAAPAVFVCIFVCAGCPDPRGQYDAFATRTAEARLPGDSYIEPVTGTVEDITGGFLLGLSASNTPNKPLQFYAVSKLNEEGTDVTLDITIHPLKTWFTPDNRIPISEPIVATALPVDDEDGTFETDFGGDIELDGDANAISGSDLVATINLRGTILSEDSYCGFADVHVTQPAPLELTGIFGAIRLTDALDPPADDLEAQLPDLKYTSGSVSVCFDGTLVMTEGSGTPTPDDDVWVCQTAAGDIAPTVLTCP